jgi:TRAP-type C4-dicarboxylate transport system substrate-binding protein
MSREKPFAVRIIGFVLGMVLVMGAMMPVYAAKYDWKLASVIPESHPVHQALVTFADKVKGKTNGEVEITVYPAGQLGQEKDYIEGAQLGSIEILKFPPRRLINSPKRCRSSACHLSGAISPLHYSTENT